MVKFVMTNTLRESEKGIVNYIVDYDQICARTSDRISNEVQKIRRTHRLADRRRCLVTIGSAQV